MEQCTFHMLVTTFRSVLVLHPMSQKDSLADGEVVSGAMNRNRWMIVIF